MVQNRAKHHSLAFNFNAFFPTDFKSLLKTIFAAIQ